MSRLVRRGCIALIIAYQHILSPLLGSHCRFYPSCSQYAREAFERRPLGLAVWLTIKRLVKCNPFHPGGYDPLDPIEETSGLGQGKQQ